MRRFFRLSFAQMLNRFHSARMATTVPTVGSTKLNLVMESYTKPYPRTGNNWFRFSLRTLLLLVTLLAAWLGWQVNKAVRHKRAIAMVNRLDGSVNYDHQYSPGSGYSQVDPVVPEWVRELVGEEYFVTPSRISLSATAVSDGELSALVGLPRLRSLLLENTNITDAGLVHVGSLDNLVNLYVSGCNVTDNGLRRIKSLARLERLFLDGTSIGDKGLANISHLPSLQVLQLERSAVSDAGLAHLARLSNLKSLSLSGPNITDEGLVHLCKMKSLNILVLRGTRLTNDALEKLRTALQNCTVEKLD